MRTLFAARWVLVFALLSCQRGRVLSSAPPIPVPVPGLVLVPDVSFWSGCRRSVHCGLVRLEALKSGIKMWKEVAPDIPISISFSPVHLSGNQIVTIGVSPSKCSFSKEQIERFAEKNLTPVACYKKDTSSILFLNEQSIGFDVIAHEIGHALGLEHHPDDVRGALMSEPLGKAIIEVDIAALCRLYPRSVGCLPSGERICKKED